MLKGQPKPGQSFRCTALGNGHKLSSFMKFNLRVPMLWKRILTCVVLTAATAVAQTGSAPSKQPLEQLRQDSVQKNEAAAAPRLARPKSYDLSAMDKSVDPCQDFYQYACGNWRKNNPIPPDQARWGRFNELADYNRQFLHKFWRRFPPMIPSGLRYSKKLATCINPAWMKRREPERQYSAQAGT